MSCSHYHPLTDDARATVLGVIGARENNQIDDAALLIREFHKDAEAQGLTTASAWTMLFTAAAVLGHSLLSCVAAHHHQSVPEALTELAMVEAES